MKGVKFGKCETWILLNAPGETKEPTFIDWDYEGRNIAMDRVVSGQILRRAKRRLERLGLIERIRKRFPATAKDDDIIESYAPDLNHSFWANYVRLTPHGQRVVDTIRGKLESYPRKPIRWDRTQKVMGASITSCKTGE